MTTDNVMGIIPTSDNNANRGQMCVFKGSSPVFLYIYLYSCPHKQSKIWSVYENTRPVSIVVTQYMHDK